MNKEVWRVVKAAEAQGWRIESTRKGWMLYPPVAVESPVALHGTPSDRRAFQNMLSDLRRRGLLWPPP